MEQQQQLLLCCCSQLDKHSISLLVHMLVVGVVTTWPCQHCRHTKASRSHIQAHTKTIILTPVLSLCTNTSALRPLNSKIAKIVVKNCKDCCQRERSTIPSSGKNEWEDRRLRAKDFWFLSTKWCDEADVLRDVSPAADEYITRHVKEWGQGCMFSSSSHQHWADAWLCFALRQNPNTKLFCVLFLLRLPSSFQQNSPFPGLAQIRAEFIWEGLRVLISVCRRRSLSAIRAPHHCDNTSCR